MALLWLALGLVLILAEVATLALAAASLAVGAFAAAAAAALGWSPVLQILIFAVVAIVATTLVRPVVIRWMRPTTGPLQASGAAEMIGLQVVVTEALSGPHQRGHVRFKGEDWPAIAAEGVAIKRGETVLITDIEGATLVVAPVNR